MTTNKKVDRSKAPAIKEFENFPLKQASSINLNNNINLHYLHSGKQPVVKIEIISKSGDWYAQQKGIAPLSALMLKEGTKNKSAYEISDYAEKYGAFYEINTTQDFVNITLICLNKYFKNLLPLIYEIITEPSFPENEFDILKNRTIQNLNVNLQRTNYLAGQTFKKKIFGENHPYGAPMEPEKVKEIALDQCKGFYSNYILPNFTDIFISGNITEDILNNTSKYFEKIKTTQNKTSPFWSLIPVNEKTREFISMKDKLQCTIRTGRQLFTRTHKDYYSFMLLNEVVGGYFGSRLMKNLREEKGFTYGVSSQLVSLINEGYWVIGTDTGNEYTSQTLEEIYKELENLKKHEISSDELDKAKKSLLGNYLSSISTPFQLMDKFKNIYFYNLDYSFYDNFVQSIKNETAENLVKIAQKYIDPDRMVDVAAGGIE